jgi:two-component system sensor histidine kinase QseC
MRSIRRNLIVTIALGVVALVIAAGAGLYDHMDESLKRTVDGALTSKAEALAAMVRMEDDGQPHLRIPDQYSTEFSRPDSGVYFQVWRASGATLARSASLQGADVPQPGAGVFNRKRFANVTLADGSPGRATRMTFYALPDEDVDEKGKDWAKHSNEPLTLIVAQNQHQTAQAMTLLLTGLIVTAVLMTAGIVALVTFGVRRGLRPLDAIARDADRISADSLDMRFPVDGSVPMELRPISAKLNELLDRLRAAFERERRFSADVAHELRTPIAELRSLCEVALRWPGDERATGESFGEALSIAKQMEATVTTLLALVRSGAGAEPKRLDRVELASCIDSICSPLRRNIGRRRLIVEDADADVALQTDQVMLSAVVRNLLNNAIEHSPGDGRVRLEFRRSSTGVELTIGNTTDGTLETTDLPYLFEPFWRKDSARTNGLHAGLGLALAAGYCRALGLSIAPALPSKDWFEMRLTIPADQLLPPLQPSPAAAAVSAV